MIRHESLCLLDPIGAGVALAETALAGHRVNQVKTFADIVRVDAVKGHAAQITGLAVGLSAIRKGAANRAVILQTRLNMPGEQAAVVQIWPSRLLTCWVPSESVTVVVVVAVFCSLG